jgi:uncharacterized protein YbjT (DUF2867 family)
VAPTVRPTAGRCQSWHHRPVGRAGSRSPSREGHAHEEIAGPESFRFEDLVRRRLRAHGDPRRAVTDPDARYFGAALDDAALLPGAHAQRGETRFADWLAPVSSLHGARR